MTSQWTPLPSATGAGPAPEAAFPLSPSGLLASVSEFGAKVAEDHAEAAGVEPLSARDKQRTASESSPSPRDGAGDGPGTGRSGFSDAEMMARGETPIAGIHTGRSGESLGPTEPLGLAQVPAAPGADPLGDGAVPFALQGGVGAVGGASGTSVANAAALAAADAIKGYAGLAEQLRTQPAPPPPPPPQLIPPVGVKELAVAVMGQERVDKAIAANARAVFEPDNVMSAAEREIARLEAELAAKTKANDALQARVDAHDSDITDIKDTVMSKLRTNSNNVDLLQEQIKRLQMDKILRRDMFQNEYDAQEAVATSTRNHIKELSIMVNFRATLLKQTHDSVGTFEKLMGALHELEARVLAQEARQTVREKMQTVMKRAVPTHNTGLTPFIVEAMAQFADSPLVQREALAALQHLEFWDKTEEGSADSGTLGNEDIVAFIILAMRDHKRHTTLQITACRLLWKLATNVKTLLGTIRSCGGVFRVLACLRDFWRSRRLFYNATGALRSLVTMSERVMSPRFAERKAGNPLLQRMPSVLAMPGDGDEDDDRDDNDDEDDDADLDDGVPRLASPPHSRGSDDSSPASRRGGGGGGGRNGGRGGKGSPSGGSPSARTVGARKRRQTKPRKRRRSVLMYGDRLWRRSVELFLSCLDGQPSDPALVESTFLTLFVLVRGEPARAQFLTDVRYLRVFRDAMMRYMDRPLVQACGCHIFRKSIPEWSSANDDQRVRCMELRNAGVLEQIMRVAMVYAHKVKPKPVKPTTPDELKRKTKLATYQAFLKGSPSASPGTSNAGTPAHAAGGEGEAGGSEGGHGAGTPETKTAEDSGSFTTVTAGGISIQAPSGTGSSGNTQAKPQDGAGGQPRSGFNRRGSAVLGADFNVLARGHHMHDRLAMERPSGTADWDTEKWAEIGRHWRTDKEVSNKELPGGVRPGSDMTEESAAKIALGEAHVLLDIFGRQPSDARPAGVSSMRATSPGSGGPLGRGTPPMRRSGLSTEVRVQSSGVPVVSTVEVQRPVGLGSAGSVGMTKKGSFRGSVGSRGSLLASSPTPAPSAPDSGKAPPPRGGSRGRRRPQSRGSQSSDDSDLEDPASAAPVRDDTDVTQLIPERPPSGTVMAPSAAAAQRKPSGGASKSQAPVADVVSAPAATVSKQVGGISISMGSSTTAAAFDGSEVKTVVLGDSHTPSVAARPTRRGSKIIRGGGEKVGSERDGSIAAEASAAAATGGADEVAEDALASMNTSVASSPVHRTSSADQDRSSPTLSFAGLDASPATVAAVGGGAVAASAGAAPDVPPEEIRVSDADLSDASGTDEVSGTAGAASSSAHTLAAAINGGMEVIGPDGAPVVAPPRAGSPELRVRTTSRGSRTASREARLRGKSRASGSRSRGRSRGTSRQRKSRRASGVTRAGNMSLAVADGEVTTLPDDDALSAVPSVADSNISDASLYADSLEFNPWEDNEDSDASSGGSGSDSSGSDSGSGSGSDSEF